MQEFQKSGTLPVGMNSSFLALVPKVLQPKLVTKFRPISLINSTSKLRTKMLAERLNTVINKLVSPNQFGIIKGRQPADSIVLTNEVCHSLKLGKASGLFLKIDFEKSVRLSKLDFP